ncbi:hypothetical protein OPQ81_011935 [Rhizoctonia solani]|nr:hypothetical protein OPQ81_011935 [Rhizoctonia solani]
MAALSAQYSRGGLKSPYQWDDLIHGLFDSVVLKLGRYWPQQAWEAQFRQIAVCTSLAAEDIALLKATGT